VEAGGGGGFRGVIGEGAVYREPVGRAVPSPGSEVGGGWVGTNNHQLGLAPPDLSPPYLIDERLLGRGWVGGL